jgi:hypothetical protein
MLPVLFGSAVFVLTVIIFWYCLPQGDKMHRYVGTELEPYVGVAFCSAFALAFTMILSGIIDILG